MRVTLVNLLITIHVVKTTSTGNIKPLNLYKQYLKMEIRTEIFLGDSKDELKKLADNSIDLIVTSPPYADQRKGTYGGIHPDKYVEWFFPISEQLLRVLKPTGLLFLILKKKLLKVREVHM